MCRLSKASSAGPASSSNCSVRWQPAASPGGHAHAICSSFVGSSSIVGLAVGCSSFATSSSSGLVSAAQFALQYPLGRWLVMGLLVCCSGLYCSGLQQAGVSPPWCMTRGDTPVDDDHVILERWLDGWPPILEAANMLVAQATSR